MGLGDHVRADDVEHGASRKGKSKGQDQLRHADGEEAQKRPRHLHKARHQGAEEGTLGGDPCGQHGPDDHHTLGDVLQGDTPCHDEGAGVIPRTEANPCGDALGQVMDGDGGNEQQDLPQVCPFPAVFPRHQLVEMGNHLVDDVQEQSPREDPRRGDQQSEVPAVFQGGQDQPQHRRRKHDPRGEGHDVIRKFMRDLFESEADEGAEHRGAAHPKSR